MRNRAILLLVLVSCVSSLAFGDEGLWLFNSVPKDRIKIRYGFQVTDAWLDHVRESSVRFNNGGSGSFVSPDGLAFTNHHVASDCLSKLSTNEKAYVKTGFYAKTRAEEGRCPDLELNVLVGIEDVTAKINGAARQGASAAEAGSAQRSAMSAIENECAKTGLRCDVVTLYSGGAYHLYKYKRYQDVRLVFAPEFAIASFGGDPDNFEFPRYALDVAFFRVYEDGKPVRLNNYLKWTTTGVKENDLVFMSGHPGSTSRLNTLAQLDFYRDVQYPKTISWREKNIAAMADFAKQSAENDLISQSRMYSFQNSVKALKGYYAALQDKELMNRKQADEAELRKKVAAMDKELDSAWSNTATAMKASRDIWIAYSLVERGTGMDSELFDYARTLVRAATEKQKPNNDRLREFRESALPSLELSLFSTAPVHDSFEVLKLTTAFGILQSELGADHPVVKQVLGGKSAAEAAKAYVAGTKLKDPAYRRDLYQGGQAAIDKTDDPIIAVIRAIDPQSRELRRRYDDEVDSVIRREGGRIAQARFKLEGDKLYPDATFTLRLSYGAVRGYTEDGRGSIVPKGTKIQYYTMMSGAFEREKKMGGKSPYQLPPSWKAKQSKTNLKTPLDFVSTADSIGGNSGSPIVNTRGELVGINFDRNMQGLGRNFYYSETGMRHIAVDARGITEALKSIYEATALVDELQGKQSQAAGAIK